MASSYVRVATWLGLFAGLAVATALVAWQGFEAVGALLREGNWPLLLVSVFALPTFVLGAVSWRLLFPPERTPSFRSCLHALWIGFSVNVVLPVANVGGEVIKARVLMLGPVRGVDAVASVVVDKAVQASTLPMLALIGGLLLVALAPDNPLSLAVFAGAALLATGFVVFVAVQWLGAFGVISRFAGRFEGSEMWQRFAVNAGEADKAIRALYARPGVLVVSSLIRLSARLMLIGEVWLAAYLMGQPIGLAEAAMLKSLSFALRGGAFAIPGGLGLQEGGYVALGALIGAPADLMLAVSLATRLREVLPSLAGLVAWQYTESRAFRAAAVTRRAAARSDARS